MASSEHKKIPFMKLLSKRFKKGTLYDSEITNSVQYEENPDEIVNQESIEENANSQIPQQDPENLIEKPPIPPKVQIKKGIVYTKSNSSFKEEELTVKTKRLLTKEESRDSIKSNGSRKKTALLLPTYKNWKKNDLKPNTPKFSINYVRIHGPDDGAYKNDSEPRGLIFMKNFISFNDNQYEYRSGSQKDYDSLLHLFEGMGYQRSPKCCESGHITKQKLFKDLKSFSEINHNYLNSAIFVIMSHGVRDKTFVTSDNEEVDLMEVYSMFNNVNCNGLKNKPKIFILHFCRPSTDIPMSPTLPSLQYITEIVDERVRTGIEQLRSEIVKDLQSMVDKKFEKYEIQYGSEDSMNMFSSELPSTSPPICAVNEIFFNKEDGYSNSEDDCGSCASSTMCEYLQADASKGSTLRRPRSFLEPIPDYSDMYSIFSTNSGGLAIRDRRNGSLLIQAICQVFSKHAFQDDIEELVRKVSKHMQTKMSMDDPLTRHAVVERVNNGLDKSFYFNPFFKKPKRRYSTLPGRY